MAAGFAATIAQILLLRELLVLFYGNEMSTALVLAGWLLWTGLGSALGALLTIRRRPREGTLALLLTLQASSLPALVLVVRGARGLFGIPLGELAPLGTMLLVCLTAPLVFCLLAGSLFGVSWAYRRPLEGEGSSGRPLTIYLGEALGSAAGGIVFYFVMLELTTALTTAVVVAVLLLAVAGSILWKYRSSSSVASRLVWILMTIAALVMVVGGTGLESRSRRWQWGENLAAAHDTPFHNIAVLKQLEQVTIFTNGVWLLTQPDPATAELAVHPALLQHLAPREVLLLGGGLAGQLGEALKHPGIERVDYVEQDPELIIFGGDFLNTAMRTPLYEERVRIQPDDAGTFLRRTSKHYDLILMSVGDPINAQMNRFYTEELFRRVAQHLRPDGIFTFSVPGGGDMVGPSHARLLGSLDKTLRQVFPFVQVVPGERARFFAAVQENTLVLDPLVLAERIRERGLQLVYLREDTLEDLMSPMRLDYLAALLADLADSPINRQFSPVCYFYGLMLWASQWHPALVRWIERAAAVRPVHLYLGVGAIGVPVLLLFWLGRARYRAAVGISVLVQGAWGMVLQVVLILSFQILVGFAYLQLALIIAFYMAGLAVGALGIATLQQAWQEESKAISWLCGIQLGVAAFPLALLVFLSPVGENFREGLSPAAASWLYTGVSLLAGVLGGVHFSLAALASTAAGAQLERTGGYLNAIDLVGAATGALAAGLFVLPLYGVSSTLILLSLLSLICLLAILRRPRSA
jgi:spermidine synthase